MELLQTACQEMHSLTPEQIEKVYQFILFQKLFEMDDFTYLSSIPGMMDSINEGVATPLNECIPLEEVWPDV